MTHHHAANADHAARCTAFLRDECGARFSSSSRSSSGTEAIPTARSPGSIMARPAAVRHSKARASPDRSVRAEQYGALPDRRVRGVGEARRRRGVRADVRRHARPTGWASHPACASTRRRAASPSPSSTPATSTPAITSSNPRYKLGNIHQHPMVDMVASSQQRQFRPGQARHASPSSAVSATFASPVTAAAPRTASSRLRQAIPGSTTSAQASRASSTMSTGRCGSWASCSHRGERRPTSCSCMRPRMQSAAATTPAPAQAAANGNSATAVRLS